MFLSLKADGAIKKLGQILAIWAFVIAVMLPIAGAYMTLAGLCPIDMMFQQMPSKPT